MQLLSIICYIVNISGNNYLNPFIMSNLASWTCDTFLGHSVAYIPVVTVLAAAALAGIQLGCRCWKTQCHQHTRQTSSPTRRWRRWSVVTSPADLPFPDAVKTKPTSRRLFGSKAARRRTEFWVREKKSRPTGWSVKTETDRASCCERAYGLVRWQPDDAAACLRVSLSLCSRCQGDRLRRDYRSSSIDRPPACGRAVRG